MIKGYKRTLADINKHFNLEVKKTQHAPKVWLGNTCIDNPTDRQRAAAIKEVEKERALYIGRLNAANTSEKLTFIRINVNWKKSNMWGYNPTAETWTSGGYYNTGRASGCGYDKESAAINKALKPSPSLTRFLIENRAKIGDVYGLSNYAGLPQIEISGKGTSELLFIFRKVKGWTIHEMHGSMFDGYTIEKN